MHHVLKKLVVVGVLAGSTAVAVHPSVTAATPPETAPPHALAIRGQARPDIALPAQAKPSGGGKITSSNGISYHNGPVMTNGVNTYIIWYGAWTTNTTTKQGIITNLLTSIAPSPYFNINTTYTNGSKVPVPNKVTLAGQFSDTGSVGTTNLSDAAIAQIVQNNISQFTPKPNANSLIFVLTSGEVTKSGFLTQYCGWHTHAKIGGVDIKYSFVGDPSGPQLSNCAAQTTSPNGDAGADAMASVIAHELEETATDPDLNAWYDSRGYENADKCAWTFGSTTTAANGSAYNMTLNNTQYLIQRNWLNAGGGKCTMSYP